jgi:hypothetical protein
MQARDEAPQPQRTCMHLTTNSAFRRSSSADAGRRCSAARREAKRGHALMSTASSATPSRRSAPKLDMGAAWGTHTRVSAVQGLAS